MPLPEIYGKLRSEDSGKRPARLHGGRLPGQNKGRNRCGSAQERYAVIGENCSAKSGRKRRIGEAIDAAVKIVFKFPDGTEI